MDELVHSAVSLLQLPPPVVKRHAPVLIDMDAQVEVVLALQASGLAPELPLPSELKLASKTVVWA